MMKQHLVILGAFFNNMKPVTGIYIVIIRAHISQVVVNSELQGTQHRGNKNVILYYQKMWSWVGGCFISLV